MASSAALAELGFIVLTLDTRGTPLRSKAFADESYGWIPSSGNTDDGVAALAQLTQRYPSMDKNRIGIFCQLYRSALQNFLERQDLYKVCVQMAFADERLMGAFIGEKYEGCEGPIADKLYPEQLADNLKGKLLLMNSLHSGVSPCYPPASTFRLVGALQQANKNFDLLVLPQGAFSCTPYMFRRAWDYLIQHLAGEAPPKEYVLKEVSM